MKKLLFLLPLTLFADVDPFKAGDLNSPNPYGLSPIEKAILNNKKGIKKNSIKIENIKVEIKNLEKNFKSKLVMYDEIINDLKTRSESIKILINEIDNLNLKIKDIEKNLSVLKEKMSVIENNLTFLTEKENNLEKRLDNIVKVQNENFQYLTSSIQNILFQIKSLNLSPKEAFKKAKQLYFSGKLDKAKELFLFALSRNYLPATINFYLGEIAFKKGNYKEALAFYKKSITLYPKKTSFTAKLLYHSGISFERLGMNKEAKLAFEKLVNSFKNSKYSTLAKKDLEKLK
jgi:TolA-binding protein